jgi:molybdopterin converting factor subunit 1
MKVRLKLFSVAKDLAGFGEREIELAPSPNVTHVAELLTSINPQFKAWSKSLRFAVNQEYVEITHALNENDEVAVIPPVSGG